MGVDAGRGVLYNGCIKTSYTQTGCPGAVAARVKREAGVNPAQQPLLYLVRRARKPLSAALEKVCPPGAIRTMSQETCPLCEERISRAVEKDGQREDMGAYARVPVVRLHALGRGRFFSLPRMEDGAVFLLPLRACDAGPQGAVAAAHKTSDSSRRIHP